MVNLPRIHDCIKTRLEQIPDPANRSAVQAYLHESSHAVKPQSLLSRLDPIVALGRRLGSRPWLEATRADVITTIAEHRFRRGAHLSDEKLLPDHGLSASTKYQWVVHLRTFYKWHLDEDHPEQFKRMPFPKKDGLAERAREMALSPLEVGRILAGATSQRDRTLILVLIETGLRASEAAALRLDQMERRNHGYWLRLPGDEPLLKTGPREVDIPVICSVAEVEKWIQQHPRRHQAKAPLFVSLSNRRHGQRMTGATISDVVVRAARRAGMRHVHAHMLRHTSATLKIAKGISDEALRLTHGWSKESTMPSYYAHMRPHYEAMMLKVHGLRSEEPELADIMGAQACEFCTIVNPVGSAICKGCKLPLAKAAQESEVAHREGILFDHVAVGAVSGIEDMLFVAVARGLGFTGGAP